MAIINILNVSLKIHHYRKKYMGFFSYLQIIAVKILKEKVMGLPKFNCAVDFFLLALYNNVAKCYEKRYLVIQFYLKNFIDINCLFACSSNFLRSFSHYDKPTSQWIGTVILDRKNSRNQCTNIKYCFMPCHEIHRCGKDA